jgi:hypothetical protein
MALIILQSPYRNELFRIARRITDPRTIFRASCSAARASDTIKTEA